MLTPLLPRFCRDNPSIRLDIRATNALVDLAIRGGSLARVPGHLQTPWFKFPCVVCASVEYLKERRRPEQPSELTGHKLIGFRNQRTGQVRPWTFRQPGKKAQVIQISPDAAAIF